MIFEDRCFDRKLDGDVRISLVLGLKLVLHTRTFTFDVSNYITNREYQLVPPKFSEKYDTRISRVGLHGKCVGAKGRIF